MARTRTALPAVADLQAEVATKSIAAVEPAQVNREEWLETAVRRLRPLFADAGLEMPEKVRVSCGFPKGNVRKVIGQCWSTAAAEDGVAQVFITPFIADSVRVLDILVHEIIHAIDNCEHGHKAPFVKMAKAMGLEGKPTATVAGEALKKSLAGIVEEIGAYPHASLVEGAGGTKKQGTRMLKVICPEDGYTLRTTAKWIAVGLPTCPCGTQMEAEAGE